MGRLFRYCREGDKITITRKDSRIEVLVKEIGGPQASREVKFDVVAGNERYSMTLNKKSPSFELMDGSGITLGVGRRRSDKDRAQVYCNAPDEYEID